MLPLCIMCCTLFLTVKDGEGSPESQKLGHFFAFRWALLPHFHIVHLTFQSIFHPLRCTPNSAQNQTSCISNFWSSPPCDFLQQPVRWHFKAASETRSWFLSVAIILLKVSWCLTFIIIEKGGRDAAPTFRGGRNHFPVIGTGLPAAEDAIYCMTPTV